MPHSDFCILCSNRTAEELLVDEYDEVYCQDCWDNLPADEKEESIIRPYVGAENANEA